MNGVGCFQITKDNLLENLRSRTENCPEQFAFNVGQSLKSGFQKCGLFSFFPDVIRGTVKTYNDPNIDRGLRLAKQPHDFSQLREVLRDNCGLTSEKDVESIVEQVKLMQKGISQGTVLANTLRKTLFAEAPKKQCRQKNAQLPTDARVLVTSLEFEAEEKKHSAEQKAKKTTRSAKRKFPEAEQEENTLQNKPKGCRSKKTKPV